MEAVTIKGKQIVVANDTDSGGGAAASADNGSGDWATVTCRTEKTVAVNDYDTASVSVAIAGARGDGGEMTCKEMKTEEVNDTASAGGGGSGKNGETVTCKEGKAVVVLDFNGDGGGGDVIKLKEVKIEIDDDDEINSGCVAKTHGGIARSRTSSVLEEDISNGFAGE